MRLVEDMAGARVPAKRGGEGNAVRRGWGPQGGQSGRRKNASNIACDCFFLGGVRREGGG